MDRTTASEAASLLLSARQNGTGLAALPQHLMPRSTAEAYAIQDLVGEQLGPIGGWKTAPEKNGVKFTWAPIPTSGVFANGADVPLAQFVNREVELEGGFVLAADLPPRSQPYTRDEVVAALGELVVCLEIFCSRYAVRTERSPLEVLADAQNAAGVVIGTGTAAWHDVDLEATTLKLRIAQDSYAATGGQSLASLIDACTDLANDTARFGGLKANQVIITGARIGPISVQEPHRAEGEIAPIGAVNVQFI